MFALPQDIAKIIVALRKGKFVLSVTPHGAVPTRQYVVLRVLDQDAGRHSGMNPGGLAIHRLELRCMLCDKIIIDTCPSEQLGVVEISDHPVVWEILKQDRHPAIRIGTHRKSDIVPNEAAPDLHSESFRRLDNCRPARTASAIVMHLLLCRADGQRCMPCTIPLLRLDDSVNAG